MAEERIDGGEGILDAFRMLGVEYVFSSPGSEWAPVWEALARQQRDDVPGPRYLDLTHETLAVGMAAGYALVTRRGQAVLLHAGTGLLQGACALHGALLSGAPMVVCSSESITYGEGEGPDPGGQWYRNLSVVGGPHMLASPFVKWANQVPTAAVLYEMVLRGGEIAAREPTGPVFLNVPLETLLADWSPARIRRPVAARGGRRSPREEVDAVAEALVGARRPVVLTESAGRDPQAFAALETFADALGVGVVETSAAVCTNFSRAHPLHLGDDPAAAGEPDLILLVNCRAPWYPPSANPFPQAKTVVIDEVPQRPHVVYQVLGAHTYLEGEVAATLDDLRDAAVGRLGETEVARRREDLESAHQRELDDVAREERAAAETTDRITPVKLAVTMRELLPADAMVVDETITHSRTLQRHLQAQQAGRWLYVQGGLGQGSGIALGAKLAHGERMVVLALGDGTFLYNPMVQALMASRDLGLPLLIVIFNNRQYLSMKLNHLRFYPAGAAVANDDFRGVDLSGQPDLSAFAGPFGFFGREVTEPGSLRAALESAVAEVAAGTTSVINVALSR